jgi:hypothetical protein
MIKKTVLYYIYQNLSKYIAILNVFKVYSFFLKRSREKKRYNKNIQQKKYLSIDARKKDRRGDIIYHN